MSDEILPLPEFLLKYKHIGKVNYEKVKNDLSDLKLITEKLDYLKVLKSEYYDKYEKVNNSLTQEEYFFFIENQDIVWQIIYGKNTPITLLKIPEIIFNKFFKDYLSNANVTFWFLKYYAEFTFQIILEEENIIEKINSPISEKFINAELKKLKDFEDKADKLLLEKKIDIYKKASYGTDNIKEIEYQRIKSHYYKTNALEGIHSIGNITVKIYARYIYLKPFLEKNILRDEKLNDSNLELNIENIEQELYLKDLFRNDVKGYNDIIELLIYNKFITKNDNNTFNWKGAEEDSSLKDKTLICTLAITLSKKDYFNPGLNNTIIAKALTNTFKGIHISNKTYGETSRNYKEKLHYSKPFYFIN